MNPASGTTDYYAVPKTERDAARAAATAANGGPTEADVAERMLALRQEMFAAAENLQFETAARLRDEMKKLQGGNGSASGPVAQRGSEPPPRRSDRPAARRSNSRPPADDRDGAARAISQRGCREHMFAPWR